MSLDQALSGLLAAINTATATIQAATAGLAVLMQAPPQTFPPPAVPAAPAMPTSPFPPAAAPVQPQQPACPFTDAAALQAWAYAKYQANPALMPAMEAIIKNHGIGQMDQARPDQLPSLYAAINAL